MLWNRAQLRNSNANSPSFNNLANLSAGLGLEPRTSSPQDMKNYALDHSATLRELLMPVNFLIFKLIFLILHSISQLHSAFTDIPHHSIRNIYKEPAVYNNS